MENQADFPMLTRSKKVSPEMLRMLKATDTALEGGRKGKSRTPTAAEKTKLQTLRQQSEQLLERTDPEYAKVMHRLAVLYHSWNSYEEAETLYRRALASSEKLYSGPNLELGLILNNLARVLFDQNKYEESQPLYERALKVLEQSVGPQHPKLATPKSNLAKLYLVQGKTEFARKLYRESVAIMEKALGPDHAKVVRAKQKLAHFLRDSESRTIGICPECNEVVTAKQPWEYVDGRAVHSICKP